MNKFELQGIDFLVNITKNANSIADILRAFDYSSSSGGYKVLKNTLKRHNIDYSHIPIGKMANLGREFGPRRNIEDYLSAINSGEIIVSNSGFKRRLIKEGLLYEKCSKCGCGNMWQDEPIILHMDHINGINNDNRIENLRILCPNCHSQTSTYAGKGLKKHYYCNCGAKTSGKKYNRCQKCANQIINQSPRFHSQKFTISKQDLEKLVWEKPTVKIARDLGVSDVAISKRCKKLGIQKPPRGYWTGVNSH
jgi:hypothetical protein